MLSKKSARVLLEWSSVSQRIISVRFKNLEFKKTTLIHVCIRPDKTTKHDFYFLFLITGICQHCAKPWHPFDNGETWMPKFGERVWKERIKWDPMELELFYIWYFCAVKGKIIGGTLFLETTAKKTGPYTDANQPKSNWQHQDQQHQRRELWRFYLLRKFCKDIDGH